MGQLEWKFKSKWDNIRVLKQVAWISSFLHWNDKANSSRRCRKGREDQRGRHLSFVPLCKIPKCLIHLQHLTLKSKRQRIFPDMSSHISGKWAQRLLKQNLTVGPGYQEAFRARFAHILTRKQPPGLEGQNCCHLCWRGDTSFSPRLLILGVCLFHLETSPVFREGIFFTTSPPSASLSLLQALQCRLGGDHGLCQQHQCWAPLTPCK